MTHKLKLARAADGLKLARCSCGWAGNPAEPADAEAQHEDHVRAEKVEAGRAAAVQAYHDEIAGAATDDERARIHAEAVAAYHAAQEGS